MASSSSALGLAAVTVLLVASSSAPGLAAAVTVLLVASSSSAPGLAAAVTVLLVASSSARGLAAVTVLLVGASASEALQNYNNSLVCSQQGAFCTPATDATALSGAADLGSTDGSELVVDRLLLLEKILEPVLDLLLVELLEPVLEFRLELLDKNLLVLELLELLVLELLERFCFFFSFWRRFCLFLSFW